MSPADLVQAVFAVVQLAILARVLLSWVDPNPYPTTELKRVLWAITDPILEPLRRVIPPIGGTLDISPIVALLILQAIGNAIVSGLGP